MKEQLQKRIQELRSEYEAGQKMLADLETKQVELRQTLLRISGAVQVLEELLAEIAPEPKDDRSGETIAP
jgi:predicted nuclease with TOPRIM domain